LLEVKKPDGDHGRRPVDVIDDALRINKTVITARASVIDDAVHTVRGG